MILAIDYGTKAIGIAIFDLNVKLQLYGELMINENLVKPKYNGFIVLHNPVNMASSDDGLQVFNGESEIRKQKAESEAIQYPRLITYQAIDDLFNRLHGFPVSYIAMDAYFYGNSYKGATALAEVVGVIKAAISRLWPGLPYVIPQPNKKYFFAGVRIPGKGSRTGGRSSRYQGSAEVKPMIVRWAQQQYGITVSDDTADAIAIGKMVATVASQGTWHYLETVASRKRKKAKAEKANSK